MAQPCVEENSIQNMEGKGQIKNSFQESTVSSGQEKKEESIKIHIRIN